MPDTVDQESPSSFDPATAVGVVDHLSVGVASVDRAKVFYDRALAPLNIVAVLVDEAAGVGYGRPGGWPIFWIQRPLNGAAPDGGNGVHVCFGASSRSEVDAFYAAALEAGGAEDGQPGLRSEYHPHYYAAFIRDPWGNKLEAVHHGRRKG
jgi:catechol 2,3-dioxygenase-like lactoylglutathione lyase family enzyme